jgi:hypothetical protein
MNGVVSDAYVYMNIVPTNGSGNYGGYQASPYGPASYQPAGGTLGAQSLATISGSLTFTPTRWQNLMNEIQMMMPYGTSATREELSCLISQVALMW